MQSIERDLLAEVRGSGVRFQPFRYLPINSFCLTYIQTDRQTGTETETETESQTNRQTETETETETDSSRLTLVRFTGRLARFVEMVSNRTHDLRNRTALLYQLGYKARWELVIGN